MKTLSATSLIHPKIFMFNIKKIIVLEVWKKLNMLVIFILLINEVFMWPDSLALV